MSGPDLSPEGLIAVVEHEATKARRRASCYPTGGWAHRAQRFEAIAERLRSGAGRPVITKAMLKAMHDG